MVDYVWQGRKKRFTEDSPKFARQSSEVAKRTDLCPGTRIKRAPTGPSNTTPKTLDEEVDIAAAARRA